jgi:hypothetical protein
VSRQSKTCGDIQRLPKFANSRCAAALEEFGTVADNMRHSHTLRCCMFPPTWHFRRASIIFAVVGFDAQVLDACCHASASVPCCQLAMIVLASTVWFVYSPTVCTLVNWYCSISTGTQHPQIASSPLQPEPHAGPNSINSVTSTSQPDVSSATPHTPLLSIIYW